MKFHRTIRTPYAAARRWNSSTFSETGNLRFPFIFFFFFTNSQFTLFSQNQNYKFLVIYISFLQSIYHD